MAMHVPCVSYVTAVSERLSQLHTWRTLSFHNSTHRQHVIQLTEVRFREGGWDEVRSLILYTVHTVKFYFTFEAQVTQCYSGYCTSHRLCGGDYKLFSRQMALKTGHNTDMLHVQHCKHV